MEVYISQYPSRITYDATVRENFTHTFNEHLRENISRGSVECELRMGTGMNLLFPTSPSLS
jgi:hypothetical protein